MSESMVEEKAAAGDAAPLGLGSFKPEPIAAAQIKGDSSLSIDAVMRIPVTVQVVLGSTTMPVANLMKLSQGSIVALDSNVGEPVDVVVNGRVVARGELVVMDDDNTRFGISLTEVVGAPAQGKPADSRCRQAPQPPPQSPLRGRCRGPTGPPRCCSPWASRRRAGC